MGNEMSDDGNERQTLSEIQGAIISSIANGREVADLEALRIAQRYRGNELLKGLPIPRLRFSQARISLPVKISERVMGMPAIYRSPTEIASAVIGKFIVAIDNLLNYIRNLENRRSIESDDRIFITHYKSFLEHAKKDESLEIFRCELYYRLAVACLESEAPTDSGIRSAVAEAAEAAFRDIAAEICYICLLDESEKDVTPEMAKERAREILGEDYTNYLILKIRLAAEAIAIEQPTIPSGYYAEANTEIVKFTGGGEDNIARITMVLHEEGLEWVEMKDGKESTKLMLE
jgi:hypothetical protein